MRDIQAFNSPCFRYFLSFYPIKKRSDTFIDHEQWIGFFKLLITQLTKGILKIAPARILSGFLVESKK